MIKKALLRFSFFEKNVELDKQNRNNRVDRLGVRLFPKFHVQTKELSMKLGIVACFFKWQA